MNRHKMIEKYKAVVTAVWQAEQPDGEGTAFDMLVSTVKGHFGLTYTGGGVRKPFDQYKGVPVNFDYAEFLSDYIQMVRG